MTAVPLPSPPRRERAVLAALLLAAAASLLWLPWDLSALASATEVRRAWARLAEFLGSFGAPDLSAEALTGAARLAVETASTALLGVALGCALGYPLAICAARSVVLDDLPPRSRSRWPRRALLEGVRLLLDILRGVPDFAWALLLANFAGIGAITGVLAIGTSLAGILGKVFSEQFDNVDPQRYAALRATGAGRLQTFAYGIQPTAARATLSFLLMRAECAIRNASVIGVVGGGGLGSGLWDAFKDSQYDRVVTLLAAMLLLTATADWLSHWLRAQLRVEPGQPGKRHARSVRSATLRRAGGLGAAAALLIACAVALRQPFADFTASLGRLEPGFLLRYSSRLLLRPDPEAIPVALREALVPIAIALLATLAATVAAAALALPASRSCQCAARSFTGERTPPSLAAVRLGLLLLTRGAALVWRGVPEIAWLLILGAFFRQGLLAGVLAVTVHSTGVLLRVFTETVDNLPLRQLALVPDGRRTTAFAYAAAPRAWPDWRTYALFQFEVNLRMGIVLGMIGAGGLGDAFAGNLQFDRLERACTFLWAMVALTAVTDRASRALQRDRSALGCRGPLSGAWPASPGS